VSVNGIAIFQFPFTCERYATSERNLRSPFLTQLVNLFPLTEVRAGVRGRKRHRLSRFESISPLPVEMSPQSVQIGPSNPTTYNTAPNPSAAELRREVHWRLCDL
jgi:hypothetical protein